jgi:nicotinate-nucleotide pyrophosphorylase (carboxylating)
MNPGMNSSIEHPEIREAVRRALEEDIGTGDITSETCIPADQMASGRFLAKERQVVAGIELLPLIYAQRGPLEELLPLKASGQFAEPGETLALVRDAPARCWNASASLSTFCSVSAASPRSLASSRTVSRAPAAAFSTRARPRPACAAWRRWRPRPAASPITAWVSTMRY